MGKLFERASAAYENTIERKRQESLDQVAREKAREEKEREAWMDQLTVWMNDNILPVHISASGSNER